MSLEGTVVRVPKYSFQSGAREVLVELATGSDFGYRSALASKKYVPSGAPRMRFR
jgi:hypothetical protein